MPTNKFRWRKVAIPTAVIGLVIGFAIWMLSGQFVSLKFSQGIKFADNDLATLARAIDFVTLEDFEFTPKAQKYEIEIENETLRLWVEKNTVFHCDALRLEPRVTNIGDPNEASELSIVTGHLRVSGLLKVQWANLPKVPVEEFEFKIEENVKSEASVAVNVAMRRLLSDLVTDLLLEQSNSQGNSSLDEILSNAKFANFVARLEPEKTVEFSFGLAGVTKSDSYIELSNFEANKLDDSIEAQSKLRLNVRLKEATIASGEDFSLQSSSVDVTLNGEATFENNSIDVRVSQKGSGLNLGKSKFTESGGENNKIMIESFKVGIGGDSTFRVATDSTESQYKFSIYGGEILANFLDGTRLSFSKGIDGGLKKGSYLKLTDIAASLQNKGSTSEKNDFIGQVDANGKCELKLDFEENSKFHFDDLQFATKSLTYLLAGEFSRNKGGLSFQTDPQKESSVAIGESVVSYRNQQSEDLATVNLGRFSANFAEGKYQRLRGSDTGEFSFRLFATGKMKSASISQGNKEAKVNVGTGGVSFKDLEIASSNKSSSNKSELISTRNPILFSDIVVSHQAKNGTFLVNIPSFSLQGGHVTETQPSTLKLDVATLLASASQFSFQGKSGTSFAASTGKGFVFSVKEGELGLQENSAPGFELATVKGPVTNLKMVSGGAVLSSKNASVDITATCRDSIQLTGGVSGFLTINSGEFDVANAELGVQTSELKLNSDGGIQSGTIAVEARIPKEDFCRLISKQIPATFDLPKQDIRFSVSRTITEKIPGDLGKIAGKFFKEVTKVVDDEIKTSFENGKVATNVSSVSMSGNQLTISGKPSVSGKVSGKLGFTVAASFDLNAKIGIEFSESARLDELVVVGKPTYGKFDIHLNKTLAKVPGANELKKILVSLLTGGKGLQKYLPSKFEHRILKNNATEKNPTLKRIINPRVAMSLEADTVVVKISGSMQ
jgi:hypothetical protein